MTAAPPEPFDLRQVAGWVRVERDVVRAAGPDAVSFLQGQLSQDIAALTAGSSAWSLLLQPQGRIDAWLRVTRTADDEFVLDVDGGFGDAVVARLARFKLRTRCDIETLDWSMIAVRGPGAADVAVPPAATVAATGWPGVAGFDLLGPDVAGPDGIAESDRAAYEALRIEAGVPRMGSELTERTIPAEAGQWLIDASASFTKGCYTGQELVARIDSRGGNVPRNLRGVVVAHGDVPPVGADILTAVGASVGSLTSVARSVTLQAPVALAFVKRAVVPPAEVTVAWPGNQAQAQVVALPMVAER